MEGRVFSRRLASGLHHLTYVQPNSHPKYTMITILKKFKTYIWKNKSMQPGVCTSISKDLISISDHETGNMLLGEALVLGKKSFWKPPALQPGPGFRGLSQSNTGRPLSLVWLPGSAALPRIWCQPLEDELGNCYGGLWWKLSSLTGSWQESDTALGTACYRSLYTDTRQRTLDTSRWLARSMILSTHFFPNRQPTSFSS